MEKELLNTLNTLTDKLNNLDHKIIELLHNKKSDQAITLIQQRNKLINVMTTIYDKINTANLNPNFKELLTVIEKKVTIILDHNHELLALFELAKQETQAEIALTNKNRNKLNGYNFTSRQL
jgi:hypothetical protein